MRVESEPFFELPYLSAAPRGGSESRRLPFVRATVGTLPLPLVILSDLQGAAPSEEGPAVLLGEAVAQELPGLVMAGWVPDDFAVLLAGDLFSSIEASRRGANGDVRGVWRALRAGSRWVAGVAGNHDEFGSPREKERFTQQPGIHLLDGNCVELDGIRIAGLSGITGDLSRPGRRSLEDQLARLTQLLSQEPDIVILHEGPDAGRRRGNPALRDLLEAQRRPSLIVCGHSIWDEPLALLGNGSTVLNVAERVVVAV